MCKCRTRFAAVRHVGSALACVLLCSAAVRAQSPAGEAVTAVQEVLKDAVRDPETRTRDLQAAIAGMQSIGDLSAALQLRDWRDTDPDERFAHADQVSRAALVQRFTLAVRDILQMGDATSRQAALNMLAEMGATTRGVGTRSPLTRAFTADVALLLQRADPSTRRTAARALGLMLPDPGRAIPVFSNLFMSADPSLRAAAAQGLVNWMNAEARLASRNATPTGLQIPRKDLVDAGSAIIPLAGPHLGDAEPEIRRSCAATLAQAAMALRGQVASSSANDLLQDSVYLRRQLAEDQTSLFPLVNALKEQVPVLTRALGDQDAQVRACARRALEDLTAPQLRMLERASQLAHREAGTALAELSPSHFVPEALAPGDVIRDGLKATVLALTAGLKDEDPRARRAALDVLETVGPAAALAAPQLVEALGDPDRFVRWAAARTLGKISPVAAREAVPRLAALLEDPDLDLRLVAAASLERYGAHARLAAPALIKAAESSDAEMRFAAIETIGAIGGNESLAAIPVLANAVADSNPRVRLVAARVLGKFGPAASEAIPALRKALRDTNADVQRAAGAALLNITPPLRR